MSKKNENLLDISFEEINRRLKNGLKIVTDNFSSILIRIFLISSRFNN